MIDPAPARLIETHTSVVVLLGHRVHKLKKAADLGFCDFRSREARLRACHDEVRLNRRLAPDVYLGVEDVRAPDGSVCDHLVLMRRMPEERRLETLVRAGRDVTAEVGAIARLVAVFHQECPSSPAIRDTAGPEALLGLWDEGVRALHGQAALLGPGVLDRIERLSRRYITGRRDLLTGRQDAGWVRDGHGDLRADDIFCLEDGPRVLDCLEFDERLRVGDVLGDIAFLAMDLERIGAPHLAEQLLQQWCVQSGETHPRSLEHLYVAYRAFVRCKVAALRHGQGVAAAADDCRDLAALTVNHLERAAVPLVVVGGLPGTGKSTLAAALADRLEDAVLLRSDVLRKQRLGVVPATRLDAGAYSPDRRDVVYRDLLRAAQGPLGQGLPVVLDASWLQPGWRQDAARLADTAGADLIELRCVAARDLVVERLRRRAGTDDASDADLAVHDRLAEQVEPWPEAAEIDTSSPDVDVIARQALALVRDAAGSPGRGVAGARSGAPEG